VSMEGADKIRELAHLARWSRADVRPDERRILIAAALAGVEAAVENVHECWCCAKSADAGPCACCELRELLGIDQPRDSKLYRREQ